MSEQNDPIRQFVIFSHFNLDAVKTTLEEHPDWLNIEYDWGEGGTETPLGAASHVGNRAIADYLLGMGAPITPTTAAMLGQRATLEALVAKDAAAADAKGAHDIPMLAHAAFSGDVALVRWLLANGCSRDGLDIALGYAAGAGQVAMTAYLLGLGADPSATNYQGKTAAEIATDAGYEVIAALLA